MILKFTLKHNGLLFRAGNHVPFQVVLDSGLNKKKDSNFFVDVSSETIDSNRDGKDFIVLPFDFKGYKAFEEIKIEDAFSLGILSEANEVFINNFLIDDKSFQVSQPSPQQVEGKDLVNEEEEKQEEEEEEVEVVIIQEKEKPKANNKKKTDKNFKETIEELV